METLSQSSRNRVIIITSIFIVLIVLTMKLEADAIELGYPWSFYTYTSAGGAASNTSSWKIHPIFFILEWLMIAAFVIVASEGFRKIRR